MPTVRLTSRPVFRNHVIMTTPEEREREIKRAGLDRLMGPWLIQRAYTSGGVTDFRGLFIVPVAAASIAAIALALFFRPPAQGNGRIA